MRGRRGLAATFAVLGGTITFTLATVAGLILHAGLPPARRLTEREINRALAGAFKGRVEVEHIGALGFQGVDGARLAVFDPEGRRIVLLDGIHTRGGVFTVVGSLLRRKGDIRLPFREVRVDHAEVLLVSEPGDGPSLVHALEGRGDETKGPRGRGVDVSVEHVTVRHAWVHGRQGALLIDAELAPTLGAARLSSKRAGVDVFHTSVIMRGLLPDAQLIRADVAGAAEKPANGSWRARAQVSGTAGDVQVSGHGTLDGKQVEAYADLPLTDAPLLRALVPGVPLFDAMSAHVETKGTLPHLTAKVDARIGPGEVTAAGVITLDRGSGANAIRADLDVDARQIDLRTFVTSAPPANLSALARVRAALGPNGLAGTYEVQMRRGTLAREALPKTSGRGSFTRSFIGGQLVLDEPGAPTTLTFRVQPKAEHVSSVIVDFDARTDIPDLMRVTRTGPLAHGRASARTHGRVNLRDGLIEADLEATLDEVAKGGATLESMQVQASARGRVNGIELSGTAAGTNLRAGGLVVPAVTARARAKVGQGVFDVRDAEVVLKRGELVVTGKVAHARIAGPAVDIDGIVIEGLGQPARARVRVRGASRTMDAHCPDIDLQRVAHFFLGNEYVDGGHVTLTANLELVPRASKGLILVDVHDASFGAVLDGAAHAEVALDGTTMSAFAIVSVPRSTQISIDAPRIELDGEPDTMRAWKGASFAVNLDGVFDLAQATALMPRAIRPPVQLEGLLHTKAQAFRTSLHDVPDLEVELQTSGLTFVETHHDAINVDPNAFPPPAPRKWRGVDVKAHATLAGTTGNAHVEAALDDAEGTLATIAAFGVAPLAELSQRTTSALEILKDMPIEAHAQVPRRPFDKLPAIVGHVPLRGEVGLGLDVAGTFRAPQIQLNATGRGVETAAPSRRAPVDVTLSARYDAKTAVAHVQVIRPEGVVLDGDGSVAIAYADLLAGRSPVPWEGSAVARLHDVPLELLTALAPQRVSGMVSGQIELRGLHKDARLAAQLTAHDLTMGAAPFKSASLDLSIKGGVVDGRARLDQVDGFADVHAVGGMQWGAELTPTRDESSAFDIAIDAKAFRAAAFLPFVAGTFSQLDGRVDAHARIHAEPKGQGGTMTGGLQLTRGRFEIPLVGEEFHNVRGSIVLRSWGTLGIENVSARGVTGRVSAQGSAKLDGLRLASVEAQVRIGRSERIPLTLQGVPMGDAWGRVDAKILRERGGGSFEIFLTIPTLEIDLPDSAGHPVQSLDPAPYVSVGVQTPMGLFQRLPLGPPEREKSSDTTRVHIVAHLGNEVQLRRGTNVSISLQGDVILDIGQTTQASGQVRLTAGKIEVYGKQFEIERGTVTFTGQDPDNPVVVAAAFWDAPDKTRIFADFIGPAKTGKLALRSEPTHTQNEILAILLFGSPDASFAPSTEGPGQQGTSPMAGIGGSFVSQGLNEALSAVSPFAITTRIDTSRSTGPRPEVQVQVTRNVSLQASYNFGLPAPGDNPDRTLLVIDWRILRTWTLETTVGDRGSSWIDLFWYYRY